MKKIYKFRVILSVKSYNEGELYEREIKNILKFYGEEAWIATGISDATEINKHMKSKPKWER